MAVGYCGCCLFVTGTTAGGRQRIRRERKGMCRQHISRYKLQVKVINDFNVNCMASGLWQPVYEEVLGASCILNQNLNQSNRMTYSGVSRFLFYLSFHEIILSFSINATLVHFFLNANNFRCHILILMQVWVYKL